jgi:hypothetical protein
VLQGEYEIAKKMRLKKMKKRQSWIAISVLLKAIWRLM